MVSKYVQDSPNVVIQLKVLAGLSNEGEYAGSGISHFLEHLLFKGTHDKDKDSLLGEIRRLGGITNASTGLDCAEYHITVPAANFDEALNLITDMVMDPVFSDAEMEKERDVILKEIKMEEDDPAAELARKLFYEAYTGHAYRHPVIGYTDRFKALTREDITKYHGRAYTPDKIVMGITGGVPAGKALKAAREKLGPYERGKETWTGYAAAENPQMAARSLRFTRDVSLGYISIAFHTTSLFSEDVYPLDVLAILIGGGNGSRLYERLVKERELLYSVSASNMTPKYPGLFIITGIGEPARLDEAKEGILEIIEEVKSAGVSEKEVERSRNIVVSGYLHSNESIDDMVSSVTSSELFTGGPSYHEDYVKKIKKVSADSVREAAGRYLNDDKSTTVTLLPYTFGVEDVTSVDAREAESVERSLTLANGLRVIIKKRAKLPLVAVSIAFPGGLLAEDAGNNGISNLTAATLLKGAGKGKEADIEPIFEDMGGVISAFSGNNSVGISMDVLAGDLYKALDIFCDVVKDPVFPERWVNQEKRKAIAAIRMSEKDIVDNGMFRLFGLIYGDHPYANRTLGTEESVSGISRSDLIGFHDRYFDPSRGVIAVVGDVDTDKAAGALASRLGVWKHKGADIVKRPVKPIAGVLKKDVTMDREEALLLVGFRGVTVRDDEKYALSVISAMLSGFGGILVRDVREEQGIAYSSGASSVTLVDPGYFILYVSTTEDNIGVAEKSVMDAVKKARDGDFTALDVESAKNKVITGYAYSLEANASLAAMMSLDELYGLGFGDYKNYPDKIKAVTREDVVGAARKVLDTDKYATVVIHSSGIKRGAEADAIP